MTSTSNKPVFRPSSAHRWSNCPGSATLEAQVPGKPASSYALEGTAAHELCHYFAMLGKSQDEISESIGWKIKDALPAASFDPLVANILIDAEMASAVWMYCEYVYTHLDLIGKINPLEREYIRFEEKVKTRFNVQGTADCIIMDWPTKLTVIDFKYGAGISVDPVENWQLMIYALGALDSIEDDFEEIEIVIVQPRDKQGETIKTWSLSLAEFKKKWVSKLQKAHTTALAKPNSFKIGAWCRWCNGAETCPKATRTTTSIVKAAGVAKVPKEIKKIQKVLEAEQLVLEFLNQCKMEAFNRLQRGEVIPGYKLVQSFGNSKWINENRAEESALECLPSTFAFSQKLKSPTQMKKALKENDFDSDWVDKHITRLLKGLVLVPESDKRSAYTSAQQDFEDE